MVVEVSIHRILLIIRAADGSFIPLFGYLFFVAGLVVITFLWECITHIRQFYFILIQLLIRASLS